MQLRPRKIFAVAALLLTTTLASCSQLPFAEPAAQLSFCQLYEPLQLSALTKEFLNTDAPLIAQDRKSMADNNREHRCLCTNRRDKCPE